MLDQAFAKTGWKDFLPPLYTWIADVAVTGIKVQPADGITVVPVYGNGQTKFRLLTDALESSLRTRLEQVVDEYKWSGASGHFRIHCDGHTYLLVSWSQQKVSKVQLARQFGIDTAIGLRDCQVDKLAVCLPQDTDPLAFFDGIACGLYSPQHFRGPANGGNQRHYPQSLSVIGADIDESRLTQQRALSQSLVLTRLLQDAPANWLTPERFAEVGSDIAKEKGLRCTVLDRAAMKEQRMGAFLSVAAGAASEPKTIIIEIEGEDQSQTLALVGKGLTFDSGGVSIKPSVGMEEMKYDMSGGAAVLGAAHFFGRVKPPVNVVCIVGAVENLVSALATRPGDIVVARNGKSIEVINTDAEGRLVLADILNYAATEYKPKLIIDAATLTGAVLFALGHCGSAILSNDANMASYVKRSGESAGEPAWELPLWPELDQEIRSEFADFANIAKPNVKAGTIMGAVFLKEFVQDCKWVHLDIAGTAWGCKATGFPTSGGSAYGMRTMIESCMRWGK